MIFLILTAFCSSCYVGPFSAAETIPTVTEYVAPHERDALRKFENNLRAFNPTDEQPAASIFSEMEKYHIPGVSLVAIHHGKIVWIKSYGYKDNKTKAPLTPQDLLQAASISKVVADLGALELASHHKLNLDVDINNYLVGWKVPDNAYTVDDPVTARMLMTHTAGINVHGFPGLEQSAEPFPSIIDVLNGKKPLIGTDPVSVVEKPGSSFAYSGGGLCILQLAIQSITKKDFASWMDKNILSRLEMLHSTYQQPLRKANQAIAASAAHNEQGIPYPGRYHNYPEDAAAGLWTTPHDLSILLLQFIENYYGEHPLLDLNSKLSEQLFIPHPPSPFGLGLSLETKNYILSFGHDGVNDGFQSLMMAFVNASKKDQTEKLKEGLIIMTNSDNGMNLITELLNSFDETYQIGFSNAEYQ